MVIIQLPVEIVIENGKVFLSETDHPVCHVLSGDDQLIAFEFLLQAVQRNGIDIFAVYNGCRKCRGNSTAMKQPSRMLCLYHMSILFVGIDTDVMFFHLYFGRNEAVSPGYGIRKLFPAIFAKLCSEFFLCHVVVDPVCRKTGKILFFFAFFLYRTWSRLLQMFRFRGIQVTDGLCLIEEDDSSIHLHEADLAGIRHLFGRTSKAVSVCQDHLFHHELHLFIEGSDLGGQCLKLLLLVQKHLDQKGLVNGIQLFFRVSDCHS